MFSEGLEESLGLDWGLSMTRRAFGNVCRLLHEEARNERSGERRCCGHFRKATGPLTRTSTSGSTSCEGVRTPGRAICPRRGRRRPPRATGRSHMQQIGRTAMDGRLRRADRLPCAMVDTPLRLSVAFGLGAAFRPATMFRPRCRCARWHMVDRCPPEGEQPGGVTSISTPDALTSGRLAVSVGGHP